MVTTSIALVVNSFPANHGIEVIVEGGTPTFDHFVGDRNWFSHPQHMHFSRTTVEIRTVIFELRFASH